MTTRDPFPGSGSVPDDATPPAPPPVGTAPPWETPSPPAGALPPQGPGASPPPQGSGAFPPPGSGAVPPLGPTPPMRDAGRTTPPGLVAGIILVVIGGALLVARVVDISFAGVTWPLWIVVPGVAMLVGSLFIPPKGGVGLAIPGTIITIVGLILWVQATYGLYSTWAYAWALVAPTGPGLGMLVYGLVHRDGELVGDGFRMILVGIGLFLGFALFFEGVIGLSGAPIANLDQILPYAVIGLGALLVVLSFFGGRRGPESQRPR
jgi:hypothetical protein